ncbi:MAG: LemA family protein [Candidatus Nanopelagicales bacterium]
MRQSQNMVVLVIVIVLVALLAVIALWQFNKLRTLNVNVDEGFAQIEVQLTRRSELIPNLVETVKGYAKHEKSVLEAVTNARANIEQADGVGATALADATLTGALNNLMVVAENYPDLKASTNFLQLQEELTTTENKIAFARQYYNESVRALNTAIVTFPSMLFVGMAGVSKQEFYEVPDVSQRVAPDVGFN